MCLSIFLILPPVFKFSGFKQFFVFLYSHFNTVLESAQDPRQRTWLLRRIRESHQEYLELMEARRRQLERENANMEEALKRIRAMEAIKKK